MATLLDRVTSLLPGWMQTGKPRITRAVTAITAVVDLASASIYDIRRAWFVATAPQWALALHAAALRMPRLADEPIEAWRRRLLTAWELYRSGGTRRGLERVLEQVLGETPDITEYVFHPGPVIGPDLTIGPGWVLGPHRWSEFDVHLGAAGTSHTAQRQAHAIIERMKPAHTQLAALTVSAGAVESSLELHATSDHSAELGVVPVIGGGWLLGDGTVIGLNWGPL